jgi:hypothetical protein
VPNVPRVEKITLSILGTLDTLAHFLRILFGKFTSRIYFCARHQFSGINGRRSGENINLNTGAEGLPAIRSLPPVSETERRWP